MMTTNLLAFGHGPAVATLCQADTGVAVALIVCHTLVLLAVTALVGLLLWRLLEHVAARRQQCRQRQWTVEDSQRRLQAELQAKMLEALQQGDQPQPYLDELKRLTEAQNSLTGAPADHA